MNINEITGDVMITKSSTEAYRDGWDRIFGKGNVPKNTNLLEEARILENEVILLIVALKDNNYVAAEYHATQIVGRATDLRRTCFRMSNVSGEGVVK